MDFSTKFDPGATAFFERNPGNIQGAIVDSLTVQIVQGNPQPIITYSLVDSEGAAIGTIMEDGLLSQDEANLRLDEYVNAARANIQSNTVISRGGLDIAPETGGVTNAAG